MPSPINHVQGLIRAIGLPRAVEILGRRALKLSDPIDISIKGHEVRLRPCNSDLFVAAQIFGWYEYGLSEACGAALNRLARAWRNDGLVPVIVDAGANVGYSTLYFHDSFPDAEIIAIEPDAETFKLLRHNCRAVAQIHPVHAALWSHENGVALQASNVGSWGLSVVDGGTTPSRRLDALIAEIPGARPLIVKLDIEGAEREVCTASPGVFASAPCILIEPHDFKLPGAGCLSPLFGALGGREVDTLLNGENLVIINSDLARPQAA